MPITEILQKNADFYPTDVSLVEINPKLENQTRLTWREYSLIESNPNEAYRKEITWGEFNKKANRFANFLFTPKYILYRVNVPVTRAPLHRHRLLFPFDG